jgi:undecaprenyl phosphate N,N'-diacetylbacillosamine 1-phosphate transferase
MLYRRFIKRFFDFIFSLVLLIILLPIILLIVLLLAISQNGKVFFLQERPGFQARPFWIIKFKTMRDVLDNQGKQLPNYLRITGVGKIIRSLSLDEILQLINVVKGDMSIVGPRPLLMKYLPRYSKTQYLRHEVLPGITGWAQVNGRNAISWEQKFSYDIDYINNQSFLLDLKILGLTFVKVMQRKGINAADKIPMREFMGSVLDK